MSFTNEERLKSIDESIKLYFTLILKTIIDISELLELRKELLKNKDK